MKPYLRPISIHATLLVVLLAVAAAGCGPKPGYSTPAVSSPLGRHGECFACGKPIEEVRPEHLFTGRGQQCVVCDATCSTKAAQMMGVEFTLQPR